MIKRTWRSTKIFAKKINFKLFEDNQSYLYIYIHIHDAWCLLGNHVARACQLRYERW